MPWLVFRPAADLKLQESLVGMSEESDSGLDIVDDDAMDQAPLSLPQNRQGLRD